MLDIILYYVITAGLYTFGKQLVLSGSPFFLSAVHLIPAGLVFLGWSYGTSSKKERVIKSGTLSLFVAAILLTYLNDTTCFIGLENIPASCAALIGGLAPFIAALLAYFFFNEKFTSTKVFALCLGFCGVLPLLVWNIIQTGAEGSALQFLTGYASMFANITSTVVIAFVFKKLFARNYSIPTVLGVPFVFGGMLSLITSVFVENWQSVPLFEDIQLATCLTFFAFSAHNVVAPLLYGYLLKKYPVTLLMFASLVNPITSAILEFVFYGRTTSYTFIFSLATLMVAFCLFSREERKEGLV